MNLICTMSVHVKIKQKKRAPITFKKFVLSERNLRKLNSRWYRS